MSLSFVHFFIGVVFIYKSSPEQYGLFSFLMSVYYLYASAQNALINTPFMVLGPRLSSPKKEELKSGLLGLLFFVIVVIFFISYYASSLYFSYLSSKGITKDVGMIFMLCIIPVMFRDFWRSCEYGNLNPHAAFQRDMFFAFLTILLIGVLLALSVTPTANLVFLIMALSSTLIIISPTYRRLRAGIHYQDIISAAKQTWNLSGWSLLGATSSWIQMQAFIYLPFFMFGIKEVAYLAAARLIMMPTLLLSKGWGNYFKPIVSKKISNNDHQGILRLFLLSELFISLSIGLYTIGVLAVFYIIPMDWFLSRYRFIEDFIFYWAIIILFMTIRNNLSSLFQASLEFRTLALCDFATAFFTIMVTIFSMGEIGINGALQGRLIGEIFLSILLLLVLKFYSKETVENNLKSLNLMSQVNFSLKTRAK